MSYLGRSPTGSILTGADIADGSISTAKIADTAVSTAKIADDAVGTTKLDLSENYAFTGAVTGTAYTKLFHIQHQEASTANGGACSADTFNDTVLNATIVNEITGASLSSNNFTLPAGTFVIYAQRRCFKGNRNFLALYSVTNSGLAKIGQSNSAGDDDATESTATLYEKITLGASHTYKLQHYTQSARSSDGLGVASNKTTNAHADVLIWQVA